MPGRVSNANRPQATRAPAVDLGPAILASFQAIRDNPTNATLNAQTRELSNLLASTGVQDRGWEGYMLLNFKKAVTGEDPRALEYLKGNLSRARVVMTSGAVNRALGMANQAQSRVVQANRIPASSVREYMGKYLSGRYNFTAKSEATVSTTLRNGGFSQSAINTGVELVKTYQRSLKPYPSEGNAGLQRDLARLQTLLPLAAKQGVISQATARSLGAKVGGWREEFKPSTPAQIAAARQATANTNASRTQSAQRLVGGLRELRDSMAARNGWALGGSTDPKYQNTRIALTKLPALEKALAAGNLDQIDRIRADSPALRSIEKAGPANVAKHLAEQHKGTLEGMERISDLVGVTPLGPFTKLAFSASVELMKYGSNEQGLQKTLVNIGIKTVAPYLDRFTGVPGGKAAVLAALRGGIESFAGDAVGIIYDPKLSAKQKATALEGAFRKAVASAFVGAVSGQLKQFAMNLEPGTRQIFIQSLLDFAGKFGIERQVKPFVDGLAN